MNQIEVFQLPNGKFVWALHAAGAPIYPSPDLFEDAVAAENAARTYAATHHPGVVFATVPRGTPHQQS